MSHISKIFPTQYNRLKKAVDLMPLQFRTQAEQAYAACPRAFRAMARRFDRSLPMALEFFLNWREDCLPRLQSIEQASQQKSAQALLSEKFLFDETQRDEILRDITSQALAAERSRFVTKNYPITEKRLHQLAQQFVDQPTEVCQQQIDNFINYLLYQTVAREAGVIVRDRQARLAVRLVQSLRGGRQVRRLVRQMRQRLRQIDDEVLKLESTQNGLVSRLIGLNIDYVTVLAARQEYEKALARLSKKAAESPAKRLVLYEKKTESIRATYLDAAPGLANLADTQKAVKEIDDVLLAVFDLDTTQRNEIMKALKSYRELVRERDALQANLEVK